jgi:predicted amidohydrolase YtcJ
MAIAAAQIKDIKPLLTMVNGKVVYEAAGQKP